MKIINDLPKEISESALKIHKAVNGNSVTDFLVILEVKTDIFNILFEAVFVFPSPK